MTEKEFEKVLNARTVYANLNVASLVLNQMKHDATLDEKRKLGIVEGHLDKYLKTVKYSLLKREKAAGLNQMDGEFDNVSVFMLNIVSIASLVPTHPQIMDLTSKSFQNIVEKILTDFNEQQKK